MTWLLSYHYSVDIISASYCPSRTDWNSCKDYSMYAILNWSDPNIALWSANPWNSFQFSTIQMSYEIKHTHKASKYCPRPLKTLKWDNDPHAASSKEKGRQLFMSLLADPAVWVWAACVCGVSKHRDQTSIHPRKKPPRPAVERRSRAVYHR